MTQTVRLRLQWTLLVLSFLMFGASLYFEFGRHFDPCPLCLMQRYCAVLLWSCAFMALMMAPQGLWHWQWPQLFFALAGLYFASRQVWLQHLPLGDAVACMPDLSVLWRYFPWQATVHALFWGSSDCAENTWQWLGMSMPMWSALFFFLMVVLASLGLCGRSSRTGECALQQKSS